MGTVGAWRQELEESCQDIMEGWGGERWYWRGGSGGWMVGGRKYGVHRGEWWRAQVLLE